MSDCEGIEDDITKACVKCHNQPSVLKIKGSVTDGETFAFKFISLQDIINEIDTIKSSRAIPIDYIPIKILKDNPNLPYILFNSFNNSIMRGSFPDKLNLADV